MALAEEDRTRLVNELLKAVQEQLPVPAHRESFFNIPSNEGAKEASMREVASRLGVSEPTDAELTKVAEEAKAKLELLEAVRQAAKEAASDLPNGEAEAANAALGAAQAEAEAEGIPADVIEATKTAAANEPELPQIDVDAARTAVLDVVNRGWDELSANDKEAIEGLRQAFGVEGDITYTNDGASTGADFLNAQQYDAFASRVAELAEDGDISAEDIDSLRETVTSVQLTKETAGRDAVAGVLTDEQRQELRTALTGVQVQGAETAVAEAEVQQVPDTRPPARPAEIGG